MNDSTSETALLPYVACPIVEMSPDEMPYGSHQVVIMMQAIQASRYFTVKRSRISWQDQVGNMLCWTSDESTWHSVGPVPDRPTIPAIAAGAEYDAVEQVMIGAGQGWIIRWGRCPSSAGVHGFICHSRPSHGNVPRVKLAPDELISVWYHQPESDLKGDAITWHQAP